MRPIYRGMIALLAFWVTLVANNLQAHFAWVDCDVHSGDDDQPQDTHALFFFGESPFERDYHLPESLAKSQLQIRTSQGEVNKLSAESFEAEGFVGLRASEPLTGDFTIECVTTYGIYHGTLLTYAAKHIHTASQDNWSQLKPSPDLPLEIVPTANDSSISCTILMGGKPLADAEVVMHDGSEKPVKKSTDADGLVQFYPAKSGEVGIFTNHTDKSAAGTHDGNDYSSTTIYATLIVNYHLGVAKQKESNLSQSTHSDLPLLPEPIASFGAVVHQGWLYAYSGHTGGTHQHSRENLAQRFVRLNLDGGTDWEELPLETPLQGLPLVAHGDYIYRLGGMNARNAPREEEDLHSVDEFSRFDPETKTWTAMPPLPEPRSSHDAVVIGNQVYVVGGWSLSGSSPGTWLTTAWSFDLSAENGQWMPLPEQPFTRRALAACHSQGKLIAVGGITEAGEVSQRVDLFDPETQTWSTVTDMPGGGMHGFGISAWNMEGNVYASGIAGIVYRMAPDGSNWTEAHELKTPRFFHRLLPGADGSLILVGGASPDGHLACSELLSMDDSQ